MTSADKIVVLPHVGEFGWFVLHHQKVRRPILLIRHSGPAPDQTWRIAQATRASYERLDDSAWDVPDEVVGASIRCLFNLGSVFFSR